MPLIDVSFNAELLDDSTIRRLGNALPDIVAAAVACPEEPWVGTPGPGDIEIRFRAKGPHDVGELDCVVEVRTKQFASRMTDKHERAERIRVGLVEAEPALGRVGVWLILNEGAWAQT
ncbi:MAG: hypothetical protein LC789_08095 [Actinobacteria bacterium]|nr:hypothetical protein [Actinomycetota bacterium]